MTRFDRRYFDSVTTSVKQAEVRTSAELVVAVYPRSGRYRDVDILCGGLATLAWLLFIVFNSWIEHPDFMT